MHVADDGERDDEPGGAAQRLNEAKDDQHLDRRGEAAGNRCRDEQHRAGDQRLFSAVAVGNWPIEKLRERKPDEIDAQRQLRAACPGVEHVRQRGKRRQEHIDRRLAHREGGGQHKDKRQSVRAERRHEDRLDDAGAAWSSPAAGAAL